MRVLIVEDHRDIADAIAVMLKRERYAVVTAYDGLAGLALLRDQTFDVAILDVALPGLDGFRVAQAVRAEGIPIAILMLTAHDAIEDRVRGLDAGADDYLVKPFAYDELAARLRSLARRGRVPVLDAVTVGGVRVDFGARSVTVRDTRVALGVTEFRLVEYLARNHTIVLTRDQILTRIWGEGFAGESNIVDVYVSAVRRKFRAVGAANCIRTIRGIGYRLEG